MESIRCHSTESGRVCDAFRCLFSGSCPKQSASGLAAIILSGMRGFCQSDCRHFRDLTCLTLTLVEKITVNLTSQSGPPEVTSYMMDVFTLMFQHVDFISQLVCHFQSEDQMISHLSAKCVSAIVFYSLYRSGMVSAVWQQTCEQAFENSSPSFELDACVWSLTEVLKRLLKGRHQDGLGKVLAAFDPGLSALCSSFLPEEGSGGAHSAVDGSRSTHWATTFCLLLDLLEVLTASSGRCGNGACLTSQRLTHIHATALLRTATSDSSEYFVKKRVLLLLKKTLLQKAGEDLALGEALDTSRTHEHCSTDTMALADCVVRALVGHWFQRVHIESAASFFGGTSRARGDESHTADGVMLRALTLVLLKSIELQVQTARATGRVDRAAEVCGYLQATWGVLRQCGVRQTDAAHCCCWFLLLFGEQDDDMMEAAKALLSIFLYHRLASGIYEGPVLEESCLSGCNPHCHFLLLIQNISYDHSILLDFLISTETCFLEYFIRYLKYLTTDWQGLTLSCRRMGVSWQTGRTVSFGGDMSPHRSSFSSDTVQSSCSVDMSVVVPAEGVACGFRLVDYDSSDDSGPESMEASEDGQNRRRETSGFCDIDVKVETRRPEFCDAATFPVDEPGRPERTLSAAVPCGQKSCSSMAPDSGEVLCPANGAMMCLSELRKVITRLQTRKLFPYNPACLLKLLAHVETLTCSPH